MKYVSESVLAKEARTSKRSLQVKGYLRDFLHVLRQRHVQYPNHCEYL
jgi:hypothetical protein